MLTYAEAEAMGDRDAMTRIRDAEKKDARQTGMRFTTDGPRLIEVSFYPKRAWWITKVDAAGNRIGDRRPLCEEEYAATRPLLL